MTKTPTKAESLAARAETLAIAEALERRFGCSALVLTADIERAAAELRCLSAENTAAVSAFLAADDERRELRTERDALRADAERWRFALTQPYEFWKRIGFMGCAEDQNEAIDAAMKGTT